MGNGIGTPDVIVISQPNQHQMQMMPIPNQHQMQMMPMPNQHQMQMMPMPSHHPTPVIGGYPIHPMDPHDVQRNFNKKRPMNYDEIPIRSMQEPMEDPIILDVDLVEEYIRLEREIATMEKEKPLQKIRLIVEKMQGLLKNCKDLEARMADLHNKHLEEDPEKTGRDLLKEIDEFEAQPPKSPLKIPLDAKKAQKEVIEFEINEKKSQYRECEKELQTLNDKAAQLLDCYLKQDDILVGLFSQSHASEKEADLCRQLKTLENKKERIETAKKAWTEAQLLLQYSCKRLAFAVQLWQDLPEVPKICLEVRYSLTEDVEKKMREQGKTVDMDDDLNSLPHCTEEELAALEAMASGSPGTVDERHLKCLNNYSECHKKAICMLKFFNRVLNTTIHRDLVEVCEEVRQTSQAVRVERVKVLKDKLKEIRGKDFDYDVEQRKLAAEEGVKRAINGYKAKLESKNTVQVRRMSQANLDRAVRRGSNGKIPISKTNELKGKARMEQRLAQQMADRKGKRGQADPAAPAQAEPPVIKEPAKPEAQPVKAPPVNPPAEKQAKPPAEKPAQAPAEKPAQKPVEKSVKAPGEKPAKKPVSTPAT